MYSAREAVKETMEFERVDLTEAHIRILYA